MNIAVTILAFLIAALSIAAGIAKVLLVPDEVQFLGGFGFSEVSIITYGSIQTLGGILFVVPASSIVGAIIVILAFSLGTVLLLLSGSLTFSLVSMLPIILTIFVMFRKLRSKPQAKEGDV